ncbi:LpqB family beta-propeller domain-containing protein [Subtercola endophyticus]|uniref:LpqB family beta-propeller domain-containing protein n=1 Tax=Subtercola endophyticus TaxID=2895559 RepID=UPI001E2BC72A|nr:LpqB family beta-propeller domain-containing protein [Subtercola endophyticus]UFS57715.1 LpqB family beta-propeller domain-containing protein [Subtercola endophyticus]
MTAGTQKRARRVTFALAGVVTALLAVTGCTGIPDSGAVHSQAVSSTPNDSDVILLPPDPVSGANQSQILNGFLQAAASPQNDYGVARKYLTDDFSKTWDPNAGVLIDAGQPAETTLSDTSISISVTPLAEVDATGQYQESASSAAVTLPFTFSQENGQWRISAANPGIILEQLRFSQVFGSHPLYFYDPTYTYLVPDVRWFAKDESTSTRVVKALLAGPAPWLGQGAVVTAFPDGTETTAVVVDSGRANVPVSSQVLSQSAQALQRMQYQLDESLSTVASVASVVMTVNQNPVTVLAGPAPSVDPRVNPQALVDMANVFGYLSGNAATPIPAVSDKIQALAPLSVVSSAKVFAVATAAGVFAVQPGSNAPVLVDNRPGLVPPSVDPAGFVWSVPAGNPGAVQAYGSDGTAHAVVAGWDGATSITSLDISRDGTRALALTTSDGQPKLVVAAVIRDKDGVPERLGNPVTLASGGGTPVDATWVDESNVASLTVSASGDDRIVLQQIGGISSNLGVPVNATTIAGGNDLSGLWLLTSAGDLQQQRGSGWQTNTTGVGMLATQT